MLHACMCAAVQAIELHNTYEYDDSTLAADFNVFIILPTIMWMWSPNPVRSRHMIRLRHMARSRLEFPSPS